MSDKKRITKSLRFEVKDAAKGLVEAVFSTFNVKDFDDDMTLPGAFEDGASVTISAYGHKSWMGALPVGKGAIRAEAGRAVLDGQFFLQTDAGKETFEVVKAMGQDQQWSYGYDVLETGTLTDEMRQKGISRVLQKLKVYEVSPVLVGAGVGTGTLSVKAMDEAAMMPKFAVGDRVVATADHEEGMSGMAGAIAEARPGNPPYYAINFDEPQGDGNPHKWLAEDELRAETIGDSSGDAQMDMEKAKARQEFVRFQKTRARLVILGRW